MYKIGNIFHIDNTWLALSKTRWLELDFWLSIKWIHHDTTSLPLPRDLSLDFKPTHDSQVYFFF